MKINKGQGISFFAATVAFAVFSVALFVLPIDRTITFWLAYVFAGYAFLTMLVALLKFFNKKIKEEVFLNTPVVVVSWLYLAAQLYLSYREITTRFLPYFNALVVNLVVGVIFTILILAISMATSRIGQNDVAVSEKILFIDSIKNELKSIDTKDADLKKRVEKLIEDITFSDPMSHSNLASIETEIANKVAELSMSCEDVNRAVGIIDQVTRLLKNRNNQCLTLKRVPDMATNQSNKDSGAKLIFAGICAALLIVLLSATLVLYIVPETKYKDACKFMEDGQYEEAVVLFYELDDYKDSKDKIEEITNILLELEYQAALQLMNDENYDLAIEAFTNLGDYKDSKDKIEEIQAIVCESTYSSAETAFAAGNYEEALELYYQVTPYKDSRDKIIDICNRNASDQIMYLGTYNDEPIAWRIIKMDGYNTMTLLADKPIRDLPISDDIADTKYEKSDLAEWLNGPFLEQFTETDLGKMMEIDGLKVSLLSESEVNSLLKDGVDLSCDSEWWIKSESGSGFRYITTGGTVEKAGDIHLRDKGVRPVIVINLR